LDITWGICTRNRTSKRYTENFHEFLWCSTENCFRTAEEESNHEGNEGVDRQVDKIREHNKKEKEKIHVSPESGGSSCQLSIMAQRYPKAQEEKF
jgi:hypothetical protein